LKGFLDVRVARWSGNLTKISCGVLLRTTCRAGFSRHKAGESKRACIAPGSSWKA